LDYNRDGSSLAVAGRDTYIRIYDDTTKEVKITMKSRGDIKGHWNRIFCVKFDPLDPNLLFSGGWDTTLILYDLR